MYYYIIIVIGKYFNNKVLLVKKIWKKFWYNFISTSFNAYNFKYTYIYIYIYVYVLRDARVYFLSLFFVFLFFIFSYFQVNLFRLPITIPFFIQVEINRKENRVILIIFVTLSRWFAEIFTFLFFLFALKTTLNVYKSCIREKCY